MRRPPGVAAVEWRVGPPGRAEVRIVEKQGGDGQIRYAVTCQGAVATGKGEWVEEPIPSERTDAHLALTRFRIWDDAVDLAQRLVG